MTAAPRPGSLPEAGRPDLFAFRTPALIRAAPIIVVVVPLVLFLFIGVSAFGLGLVLRPYPLLWLPLGGLGVFSLGKAGANLRRAGLRPEVPAAGPE